MLSFCTGAKEAQRQNQNVKANLPSTIFTAPEPYFDVGKAGGTNKLPTKLRGASVQQDALEGFEPLAACFRNLFFKASHMSYNATCLKAF